MLMLSAIFVFVVPPAPEDPPTSTAVPPIETAGATRGPPASVSVVVHVPVPTEYLSTVAPATPVDANPAARRTRSSPRCHAAPFACPTDAEPVAANVAVVAS